MIKNNFKKIEGLMMLMLLLCGIVGSSISASALTSYANSYNVSAYGTWNIFVKKAATEETKTQYVKNSSGYGEYGYCYFKIEAKLGTDDTTSTMMTEKKISKDSKETACTLSNTVGKGKTCILRVTGTSTQTGKDAAYIRYYY